MSGREDAVSSINRICQSAYQPFVLGNWAEAAQLAVVLIDLGQITEGYRLIDSLPPEVVRCPCQCRRFATACAALGDHDQAAGFLSQAERLTGKLNDTAESDPFPQQTDLPRLHDEPS